MPLRIHAPRVGVHLRIERMGPARGQVARVSGEWGGTRGGVRGCMAGLWRLDEEADSAAKDARLQAVQPGLEIGDLRQQMRRHRALEAGIFQ